MDKLDLRIKIEIVEHDGNEKCQPEKQVDGSFALTINKEDAYKIDSCEKAFMQISYPAIRENLSRHFTEVSKKKPYKKEKIL